MKIAIYSIAKDEHSFVDRFMDSCVDADVVVVGVDPGDTTGDLLSARGAQVVRIDLPKFRFDAYRNAVLTHITHDIDICVSLDLDEVLPDGWREDIEKAWTPGTTRLHYHLQWSEDSKFDYDRIHARHGYIWRHVNHEGVYAIHPEREVVANSGLTITHLPDATKDRTKNLPLLQYAVEEEPDDPRMNWYLLREYYYEGMYEECIKQTQDYMALNPPWAEERVWACIFCARAWDALDMPMQALAWLNWAARTCTTLRDGVFELALFHYENDECKMALEELNAALRITRDGEGFFEQNGAYNHEIHLLKGKLLIEAGDGRAKNFLKRALRIKPDLQEAQDLLDSL